jgi:hypothetical protein
VGYATYSGAVFLFELGKAAPDENALEIIEQFLTVREGNEKKLQSDDTRGYYSGR